jgi:hypothetical protein
MPTINTEFSALVSVFAAGVSAFGALIALLSIWVNRRNWLESNRPIVTAYIDEESSGDGITIFNLYLKNSGTRPATGVRLSAPTAEIHQLLEQEVGPSRRSEIEGIFTKESRVSVLHQGETLVTSFGLASTNPSQRWLKYGHEVRACVLYADLEGRQYKSFVPLRLRPREGFGGGVWRSAT